MAANTEDLGYLFIYLFTEGTKDQNTEGGVFMWIIKSKSKSEVHQLF